MPGSLIIVLTIIRRDSSSRRPVAARAALHLLVPAATHHQPARLDCIARGRRLLLLLLLRVGISISASCKLCAPRVDDPRDLSLAATEPAVGCRHSCEVLIYEQLVPHGSKGILLPAEHGR